MLGAKSKLRGATSRLPERRAAENLPPDHEFSSRFTTYQRDPESGLDYAIDRYYGPTAGRFESPDTGELRVHIPLSLNRYLYTLDDPVNYTDSTGSSFASAACDSWGGPWCIPDPFSPFGRPGLSGICPNSIGLVEAACAPPFALSMVFVYAGANPPEPEPECFAQLKYHAAFSPVSEEMGWRHYFWYVQGSDGQLRVLSGALTPTPMQGPESYIVAFFLQINNYPGDAAPPNSLNNTDSAGNTTLDGWNFENAPCSRVDAMIQGANSFPKATFPYGGLNMNSNTAASYLAQRGGFAGTPPDAPGWGGSSLDKINSILQQTR